MIMRGWNKVKFHDKTTTHEYSEIKSPNENLYPYGNMILTQPNVAIGSAPFNNKI